MAFEGGIRNSKTLGKGGKEEDDRMKGVEEHMAFEDGI